jgi:hypothetical protein
MTKIGLSIAMVIGALLVTTVVVPVVLWLLFRFIARRADRRALARPPIMVGEPGRVTPVLIGCSVLAPLVSVSGALLSPPARLPVALLGLLAMVSAWLVHGLPGHSRNLKYALYLVGSAALGQVFIGGGQLSGFTFALSVAIGMGNLVVAVVCIALLRPDAPLAPGDPSSRRAYRAYRAVTWIQGPDLLSLLAVTVLGIVQLGIPYVFIRWCVGARVSRRALIYLRSFHDQEAGRVFARIITPALHRNVAVTGLVHLTQPTSALSREVPLLWRSRLIAIADANWRTWVERHLHNALAVVVDVSVPTESVTWELERARAILPPERVLILRRASASAAVDPKSVSYDLATPAGIAEARASVNRWLGGALATVDAGLVTQQLPVSPPRRQLPILPLLILAVGLPAAGLTAINVIIAARYRLATARNMTSRVHLREIRTAAQLAMVDGTKACPTFDDLVRGRYLSPDRHDSPETIRIDCEDDDVIVRSAGPDALFGTPDDLSSKR